MMNDQLNTLAMLNVHLDLHPTSEDMLCRFIALGPYRLDFDVLYVVLSLSYFVLLLLLQLNIYILYSKTL